MKIEDIKNPKDVLEFMKANIKYGWMDINNQKHIEDLENVRATYRTMSLEETLKEGIGTCIEQANLMHYLLDSLGIENKMFCCRIEASLEEKEHIHCFVVYKKEDKYYHIEHPDWERIGIYEYKTLDDAIDSINHYYEIKYNGNRKDTVEYNDVPHGISYQEFNEYINNIDKSKVR